MFTEAGDSISSGHRYLLACFVLWFDCEWRRCKTKHSIWQHFKIAEDNWKFAIKRFPHKKWDICSHFFFNTVTMVQLLGSPKSYIQHLQSPRQNCWVFAPTIFGVFFSLMPFSNCSRWESQRRSSSQFGTVSHSQWIWQSSLSIFVSVLYTNIRSHRRFPREISRFGDAALFSPSKITTWRFRWYFSEYFFQGKFIILPKETHFKTDMVRLENGQFL